MNKKDLEHFKKKLSDEERVLEGELAAVARPNPAAAGGWEATSANMDIDAADENEVADKIEGLEENTGITTRLENQLMEVKNALERLEKGTYGLCEVCGKPIETERLEANPSARISIKHGHTA